MDTLSVNYWLTKFVEEVAKPSKEILYNVCGVEGWLSILGKACSVPDMTFCLVNSLFIIVAAASPVDSRLDVLSASVVAVRCIPKTFSSLQ